MAPSYAYAPRAPSEYLPTLYWVSDGGRGEPKQVGRVTPCAPLCPPISRRARSDAPYPPSLRHYPGKYICIASVVARPIVNSAHERSTQHLGQAHADGDFLAFRGGPSWRGHLLLAAYQTE